MSQKTNHIQEVVSLFSTFSEVYRKLVFRMDQYKDNTWTVGGADEITQSDITNAGYEFTPSEFKAAVDTTVEAINQLMNNESPAQSDYDKKINNIL